MAEALPSTSQLSGSSHEKNIAMLLEKLKEFRMGTENSDDRRIYGRVESKFSYMNLSKENCVYINFHGSFVRFASKRT